MRATPYWLARKTGVPLMRTTAIFAREPGARSLFSNVMDGVGQVWKSPWSIIRAFLLIGGVAGSAGVPIRPVNPTAGIVSSILFVIFMGIIWTSFPRWLRLMKAYHNPANIWGESLLPLPKNSVSVFHALSLYGASNGFCTGTKEWLAFGYVEAEHAAETLVCCLFLAARHFFWRNTAAHDAPEPVSHAGTFD